MQDSWAFDHVNKNLYSCYCSQCACEGEKSSSFQWTVWNVMLNMCTNKRGNWYPILSSLSSDCEEWLVCGKCDHVLLLQVDLEDLYVEEKHAIWKTELPENASPIGYCVREVKGGIAVMGVIKLINDTGLGPNTWLLPISCWFSHPGPFLNSKPCVTACEARLSS